MRLTSQITGGGQEEGFRSGTLNVPGIVGMARAVELCCQEMPSESQRQATLRNRLFDGLTNAIRTGRLKRAGTAALRTCDWPAI